MVDINKIVEINPLKDAEYRPLLRDLQGNIIKGNGRENAVHLFLKFKDGQPDQVKEWLGEFTRQYVTSAWAQAYEAENYRQTGIKGSVFTNVFLTIFGYDYLGLIGNELPFDDDFFLGGMKDPNSQIGFADPTVNQWEAGLQQTFHGLIMMADDNLEGLLQVVDKVTNSLSVIADIVHRDDGFVLRNKDNKVIEHFGFRDGVSQPLFVTRDIETERKFDPTNFSNWDPRAPLSLVLLKDPFGKTPDSYGSYLVYRKLEQNVPGWNNDVVNNLAPALNSTGDPTKNDPALAGAYTMGRFQDGTPVVLTDSAMGADTNNFNYLNDTTGSKCPFHSHIRKTNPRGDTGHLISTEIPLEEEKMHRIVRRAVSYGEPDRDQAQETGSGLLFLCFQSNITNQFAFMQKRWANTGGFIEPGTGTDPVIGQGGPFTEGYNWPKTWGSTERTQADFSHWVNFKGGEFFFTPSLSFLESLNEGSVPQKRLKAKHSGKSLDVATPMSDCETNIVQSTSSSSDSQVWLLEEAGEGYYFIRNQHSGLVLTVQSVSGDVQNVYATIKYGGDAQLWQTVDNGHGFCHIVS
jgi:Dyp-type peroxidase family